MEKVILHKSSGSIQFPDNYLQHFHTHILCSSGSMNFVFNGTKYTAKSGEFVFWFADSQLTDVTFSKNFKANVLFVEKNSLTIIFLIKAGVFMLYCIPGQIRYCICTIKTR